MVMTVNLAMAVIQAEELGYIDELLTLMEDYYSYMKVFRRDGTDFIDRRSDILAEAFLTLGASGL